MSSGDPEPVGADRVPPVAAEAVLVKSAAMPEGSETVAGEL